MKKLFIIFILCCVFVSCSHPDCNCEKTHEQQVQDSIDSVKAENMDMMITIDDVTIFI